MTTFTVRLKTDNMTKVEAYVYYGKIASAMRDAGLYVADIIDDVDAAEPASTPSKTARKPRGPNRAKAVVPQHNLVEELKSAAQGTPDNPMPTFLKRERE